ncbi:MAG: DALR anticodon-binding domain-containing protein, partial [Solirubrobacterales bacterium]
FIALGMTATGIGSLLRENRQLLDTIAGVMIIALGLFFMASAQDFSAFYRDCPVVGADPALAAFRLELCAATRDVLARALDLLGVAAPETMERED